MQGPAAFLSSLTREIALIIDQFLHSSPCYYDYDVSLDYATFFKAFSINLEKVATAGSDNTEAANCSDKDENPVSSNEDEEEDEEDEDAAGDDNTKAADCSDKDEDPSNSDEDEVTAGNDKANAASCSIEDEATTGSNHNEDNAGHCEENTVIRPLPWVNAPKADGSTSEFKERLAWCKAKMDHLASHTPHHFLKHHKRQEAADQQKKRVNTSQGVKQKAVDKGQSRRQKRKVCDEDEDDAGMFWTGVTYALRLT
jgi:hypothetical protein